MFMAGTNTVKINLNEQANKILEAAQKSGLEQNFLFVTTFKRYQVQLKMLSDLEQELNDSGILITKEYVKGRQNVYYTHPAVNGYNKTPIAPTGHGVNTNAHHHNH
jgi:predicted secreted Zn-dependent protease